MPEDSLLHLAAELQASQETRDLAESLTQILKALDQHWTQTHLTWFTDHGVDHARRVAKRALELSAIPGLSGDLMLSGLERYILCAASLLHDIGMNDLSLSPHPLGRMLPEDYDRVRHEHSLQSGVMIRDDAAKWGLPPTDRRLAEIVSLIAQAHGTKHYRTTIPLLVPRGHVRDDQVRGPLLAALLLMADELDLSYGRAGNVPGNIQLNAISEAHAFKHQCISSAGIDIAIDGTIRISLQLSMPNELAEEARANIERWVIGKLRRQMALVDPEMTGAFGSRVHFSRAIGVTYVPPLNSGTLPSDAALAVINAEVALEDLIDHRDKFRRAGTALRDGHVVITGKWAAETRHDSYGREDLYQATIETLRADPDSVVVGSRRLHDMGASEVSDVLEEWVRGLGQDQEHAVSETADEQSARTELLAACAKAAEALNGYKTLVLGVSCFDKLTEEGMRWLVSTAVPQISHASSATVRLIITAESESPVPALEPQVSVIPAEDIDADEVLEFLLGIGLAESTVIAESVPDYFTLKKICNRKFMHLQVEGSK